MGATTALVRVPLHELGDEYVGLRLLITGPRADGSPMTVLGGVSDVARVAPGAVDVWVGGLRLRLGAGAFVAADAPPEP